MLGAETGGAIHLDSCREAGLSDEQLAWLVETRRWQSPLPRVYVTFSGPIPTTTLQHAALLYAGVGAVLSHETAGYFYRLCREPGRIHLTVRYDRDVADQPGLVIHRSRTLIEADTHPVFTPRRTTAERTVLDLLAGCPTADAALGLVADACGGVFTSAEKIRDALTTRTRTRWRKVVLEALPDVRAGAQSAFEVRDARMRRAHNLPTGDRQFVRHADGTEHLDIRIRKYRMDVELDGRLGHNRSPEVWRDMRRDNRSEVERHRHLRYGWADMIERECEVAIQQALILRQQGWTDQFRRCPKCPPDLPPGL